MAAFDVVIASLPYIETEEPMMAPALLKGVVKKTGLSCYTIDLNAEVCNRINQQFSTNKQRISEWFLYREHEKCAETIKDIDCLIEYSVQRILELNPRWICLSLFCHTAQRFNIKLCKRLKQLRPNALIVVGGNAIFTDDNSKRPYATLLKKAKLIDHYIVGDGEEPLFNLLTGSNEGVDKDNFQQLDDLGKQPYSDYDDYDWDLYECKRIPMYASRGCVRRCTFCDVYKIWKKFKIKNAEDVFDEMLYQIEKTGITHFYFRDSLINGSISEYRKLMTLLADYNETHKEKIQWTSFFIFRPQSQMPESDWILTARSGASSLVIGVESLVDSIRFHMRKKFTNTDMDFGLEMAKKYNVGLALLLIIGYVNETQDDFDKSLQWLEQHQHYASSSMLKLSVGGTLTVNDLTDLYQQAEGFDITLGNKIHLWENKKIGLTYEVREQRKKQFLDYATKLGYKVNYHEKPIS